MAKFLDNEFEADQDLSILEEAQRIKEDDTRLERVRDRIDARRRQLDEVADQMDEPDLPEEGVIKLGGLDKDGQ